MADDNVIYHEEVVGEYPIEYEEWDGTVAHEVTVEDGDEYIQVEELDDGQQRYIEIPHGAIYEQHHLQHIQSEHLPESELLHTRPDGSPLFTIPLQDLMSKQIDVPTQPPRSHTIVCFSKMCQTQLVFDGYLYTLTTQLNQMAYNIWRCVNENCTGAVRTSPNFASVKLRADHDQRCEPDENQLRIRVAVYDLNLLCEFMDCEMGQLYDNYVRKLRNEQPDLGSAFLDFELLQPMMEHHRLEMPFRKRFEARKAIQQRRREGLIIEKSKFKRTKPFPPSICTECNMEFPSGDLAPSQDLLIQHLTYQHERPLVIERYTFPEPNLFEAWIRELSQHSRYRLRKVGLYDEHMYYLCCSDDRQQRCNHGRGSIIHTQCSAFIRVHDWRYILRREIKQVIVDYCLDHCFHSGDSPMPDTYRQPIYDYYSPEVFMKEMEAKKARTQKMLQSAPSSIRSVRRLLNQPNTVFHPNVNSQEEVYIMDQGYQEMEGQEWVPEEQFQQQQIEQQPAADRQSVPVPQLPQNRVTFNLMKKEVPLLREDQRNSSNHVTVRQNFDDRATFESVLQLELQCDNLKQRMQQCRRPEVARRYLQRLTGILEDVLADPHCSPKSNGAVQEEVVLEEAPGPSRAAPRFTTVRPAARQQTAQTPPIREAMFLQRSENGQMVVVKRPIKKAARRTVQVVTGQESVVQPLQPGQERQVQPVRRVVQPVQQKSIMRQEPRNEMPANFLEPERKSNRIRRAPHRPGAE